MSALVVCDGTPEDLLAIAVQRTEHDGFRRRARLAGLLRTLVELLAELGEPAGERFQRRGALGRGGWPGGLLPRNSSWRKRRIRRSSPRQRLATSDARGDGGHAKAAPRQWLQ